MATNTPYNWSSALGSIGGGLGSYAGQTSDPSRKYRNLYAPIGKYLGGMAGSLASGKPFDNYLTSTLGSLGNIAGSALGGQDNRWAGPTGQIAGTALSSLLQGKNPLSTMGTPASLSGYGGALGSAFGGKTGGIAGTIGGNVLGNVYQGYKAGTGLPGMLSNIGGMSNLLSLGSGLLPYIMPKNMDPVGKSILSSGIGVTSSAIGSALGTAAPTLGSAFGLTGALGATPIGVAALPITMAWNIYSDYAAQKKARKADERYTAQMNRGIEGGWRDFEPFYNQVMDIGKQRLAQISNMPQPLPPTPGIPSDPNTPMPTAYEKYGIDPTTGFTPEEMFTLFGDTPSKYLANPAPRMRSSYSKHIDQWPFSRGMFGLMVGGRSRGLDYEKIMSWLNLGSQKLLRPEDKEIAQSWETASPGGQTAYARFLEDEKARKEQAANWERFRFDTA